MKRASTNEESASGSDGSKSLSGSKDGGQQRAGCVEVGSCRPSRVRDIARYVRNTWAADLATVAMVDA